MSAPDARPQLLRQLDLADRRPAARSVPAAADERFMLPMTVLRRFDCVLAPNKAKVLAAHKRRACGCRATLSIRS